MGNKKQRQRQLIVRMKHAPAPDAEGRLSRAIDVLLKAAARDTTKSEDSIDAKKGTPPSQSS